MNRLVSLELLIRPRLGKDVLLPIGRNCCCNSNGAGQASVPPTIEEEQFLGV